ncbi:MAG: serine hydrolase [Candidatus Aminicenantes bacterium]|nr:serine hydrolase [Candidatus Aminicenantes bacterium]
MNFRRASVPLTLILLLAAAATLSAAAPAPKPPAGLKKALDAFRTFYAKGMEQAGIVGGSLLILHDNKVVDKAHFGMANQEKSQPVDDRTIYHWASITKTMTGIAILQLRDRGRLGLDDPIVKYIPELRQVHDPFGDMSEITAPPNP